MDSVEVMDRVDLLHLQTANSGPQNPLKHESYFVQRVTPGIGEAFCPVDKALQKSFLLSLFHGGTANIPVRGSTRQKIK